MIVVEIKREFLVFPMLYASDMEQFGDWSLTRVGLIRFYKIKMNTSKFPKFREFAKKEGLQFRIVE